MRTTNLVIILSMGLITCLPSQLHAQKYDKGKHYQWRAMENGKWKFSPKFYYWLFHSHYKDNYGNNSPLRISATGSALLTIPEAGKENIALQSQKKAALKELGDRQVDASKLLFSSKENGMYNAILQNLRLYSEEGGGNTEELTTEFLRIKENIEITSGAHLENSKRAEAYMKAIKDLEDFNYALNSLVKIQYVSNVINIKSK